MQRLITSLTGLLLLTSVCAAEEAVTQENAYEPRNLDHDSFKELVVDISSGKGEPISDKAWFVKFFAPWCGHCQRLAPTWADFAKIHEDDLNVAIVDCTSSGGQPLCKSLEVRGYPTLLFFPSKNDLDAGEKLQAIKYQGQRTMEAFEDYAFNGGWRSASEDAVIPLNREALESWGRWAAQQKLGLQRDIDTIWKQYQLDQYVPPPYHYSLVAVCCILPFVFLITLLCCMFEDEEPVHVKKPNHSAKEAGSSPKKASGRPEKLD